MSTKIVVIGQLGLLPDDAMREGQPAILMDGRYWALPVDLRIVMIKSWIGALEIHLNNCKTEESMEEGT